MTVTNSEIGAYVDSLSDVGTPASGDELLIYDVSASTTKKVQASAVAGLSGSVASDAIWDAAGDLAVGSGANTAAKLSLAQGKVGRVGGVLGYDSGSSFPGSPSSGDRYWRTDLAQEFYYDGTRWLSTALYHLPMSLQNVSATGAYPPISASLSGTILYPTHHAAGGSDIWLVALKTIFLVSGGTALSASHKWVGQFIKRPTGNTDTVVVTINVDSGSSSVWREDNQNIGALLNNGTTHFVYALSWTKTGTPGTLFGLTDLTYRIVAT